MSSIDKFKIFIDVKQLLAYRVSTNTNGETTKTPVFNHRLEKDNLAKVLVELKAKTSTTEASLYFADGLVVTNVLTDESGSALDRESVGRLIKAKMNIDPEKAVWDYTKVDNFYQIVCLPADYTDYIAPAFVQAGIKIESIDPISVSLAKATAGQSEPVMLVYDDVERLVACAWQGLVFEPTLFIPVELSNKAKKLKQSFIKRFNQDISLAIVSAGFADPYIADLTALALKTEIRQLDPFIGEADVVTGDKKESRGDDKNEANAEVVTPAVAAAVDVDSEKPEDFKDIWEEKPLAKEKVVADEVQLAVDQEKAATKAMPTNQPDIRPTDADWVKPKSNLTWLWIIVPLLITFIVVAFLLFGNKGNGGELINPLIESSIGTNQTAASASGQITDKAKLKIQVLNGSGKAGEAAKVKGLLERAGFTVEAIGNATTSSAIKTEIKSKTALSETMKKDFQDSLAKLYDLEFSVNKITGFDVVVTVGKSK